MLMDILALVGAAALFALVITGLSMLAHGCRNVLKIARDYRDASEQSSYCNTMLHLVNEVKLIRDRLYTAERDCSNARRDIRMHIQDYKHTKTARKVAIDKKRKQAEQEYRDENNYRGGDGM